LRKANWEKVRSVGRGERRDYGLSKTPIPGGQAHVFPAIHKATEIPVAFKRLRRSDAESIARMRREIEVGRQIDDANVMPILDADEGWTWFVMPLATGNLDERRQDVLRSDGLRLLIESICSGLAAAHAHKWVHRDIKPANILSSRTKIDGWSQTGASSDGHPAARLRRGALVLAPSTAPKGSQRRNSPKTRMPLRRQPTSTRSDN
jgi:serine/threonine-protein kinase